MNKLSWCCITSFYLLLVSSALTAQTVNSEQVRFTSHSVELAGTIVYPKAKTYKSIVVFVHGSGPQQRNLYWANKFAEAGIAALVYDKRGVGQSGGSYEAKQSVSGYNIALLADDAAAAINFLQQHTKTRQLKKGLVGISQAGWIIPIAAEKSKFVDYLVLWSGPVCKVSEEDIFSKYTSDLDQKHIPSFQQALNSRTEKYIWPTFLGKDTDATENLANLSIPGFWIFGGQDGSIPVDLSIQHLQKLIDSGQDYQFSLRPKLGHNNMDETFSEAISWINKQVH